MGRVLKACSLSLWCRRKAVRHVGVSLTIGADADRPDMIIAAGAET